MKITSVMVLVGRGTDRIMMTTDLPCATWPYNGFQSITTEAAAGSGVEYVRKHFGIEPQVVNVGNANHKET